MLLQCVASFYLTAAIKDATVCRVRGMILMRAGMKKTYSTEEAARQVQIHRATLMRWLAAGKVKPSIEVLLSNGNVLHRWTEADIRQLATFKKENYWQGGGRPPKEK
jgi:predicted DNA-binding protein (UPF0251 family)